MENYVKAPTVPDSPNKQVDLALIETLNLDSSVFHMNVKTGSKVANLLSFANKKFKDPNVKQVSWNGVGEAMSKVVACVEIMKKETKDLYQINKIGFIKSEETWNSKLENLRDIKVTKMVPSMSIVLSKIPLNPSESGYQTKSSIEEIFDTTPISSKTNKNNGGKHPIPDEVYVKKKSKQIKIQ